MAHVTTITIDHTKVPGDLTDYVGLIVPDGSAGYAALYALCLEGGGDIRLFKSDDTTEIAREIVSFSVSAETGEIHYKYSGTLSSSVDTDIHVYADGSSSDYAVGATYGRNAVWTDYSAVWHLSMASGNSLDSTGNSNAGTVNGNPVYEDTTFFADGVDLDGNDYFLSADSNELDLTGAFTVSTWAKHDGTGDSEYLVSKGEGVSGQSLALFYKVSTGSLRAILRTGGGAQNLITGSTNVGTSAYMAHFTKNGSNQLDLYLNGASDASTVSGATQSPSDTTSMAVGAFNTGASGVDGQMCETRVLKGTALSANWITTEYNNQNSYSTFYSVAAVAGGSTSAQAARRGAVMMM